MAVEDCHNIIKGATMNGQATRQVKWNKIMKKTIETFPPPEEQIRCPAIFSFVLNAFDRAELYLLCFDEKYRLTSIAFDLFTVLVLPFQFSFIIFINNECEWTIIYDMTRQRAVCKSAKTCSPCVVFQFLLSCPICNLFACCNELCLFVMLKFQS